jgi:hypothetical protein
LSEARRGKKHKINNFKATLTPKLITSETRLKLSSRCGGIKVKLFDNSNNLINHFPTMTSAAKALGVSDRTIRRILNTGISYDNYTYKFEVEFKEPIIVVNKEDNTIKKYYSMRTLAKDIGVTPFVLSNYVNTNKLLKDIYLITN